MDQIEAFGSRTSSYLLNHPDFISFAQPKTTLRYVDTSRAWVAANEPLVREEERLKAFLDFDAKAREEGKAAYLLPASKEFATKCRAAGFATLQLGAEPIFELRTYFGGIKGFDPLGYFPRSLKLRERGVRLESRTYGELLAEDREQIQEMIRVREEARDLPPMSFLNGSQPFEVPQFKRYFLVREAGGVMGFVCAVPLGQRRGYYFSEILTAPQAPSGLVEFMVVEAMRWVKRQNLPEVRLGMCPLAMLEEDPVQPVLVPLFKTLFARTNTFYGFKKLFQFKAHFAPSRWEPLYLVSSQRVGFSTLFTLLRAHYPQGLWKLAKESALRYGEHHFDQDLGQKIFRIPLAWKDLPKSLGQVLARSKVTTCLVLAMLVLHMLRLNVPAVHALFETSGFVHGRWSLQGIWLGPLFHNHTFHLMGDLINLWGFGVIIESMIGLRLLLPVLAFGLWLSNPVTSVLLGYSMGVWPFLESIHSVVDYGSSNGVYALAGCMSAILVRGNWVWVPYTLWAGLLTYDWGMNQGNWLTFHHFVAMFLGYGITRLLYRRRQ